MANSPPAEAMFTTTTAAAARSHPSSGKLGARLSASEVPCSTASRLIATVRSGSSSSAIPALLTRTRTGAPSSASAASNAAATFA
eukprot:CAMPEP_0185837160 /NCGR_PEP_ID=MMETSP1353-20130828/10915_1 /TAXON_ID=1077150 /ORGANISM="Erythrolobus australicus, Strain CCMP3124" /LENGTH=84 /DNA_ID=CAMNT_0028536037 /DNA_START=82 /DNA_END=333 /DNA_ORIENTATION=-